MQNFTRTDRLLRTGLSDFKVHMPYILYFAMRVLATPSGEPAIVDQVPNYGGPTTTIFYVTGGVIVTGALVLWMFAQLKSRRDRK